MHGGMRRFMQKLICSIDYRRFVLFGYVYRQWKWVGPSPSSLHSLSHRSGCRKSPLDYVSNSLASFSAFLDFGFVGWTRIWPLHQSVSPSASEFDAVSRYVGFGIPIATGCGLCHTPGSMPGGVITKNGCKGLKMFPFYGAKGIRLIKLSNLSHLRKIFKKKHGDRKGF